MTKEYLKMADVFAGDLIAGDDDLIRDEDGLIGDMLWPSDCVKYAAHAINSHDELVAEVGRLHEFERDAMRYRFLRDNCTTQQADSCGPIFVMTIRQKDNPFNVGLSIDEAMNGSRTDE